MIVAIVDVLTSFDVVTNDNRQRASSFFFLALYNLIYSFIRSLISGRFWYSFSYSALCFNCSFLLLFIVTASQPTTI